MRPGFEGRVPPPGACPGTPSTAILPAPPSPHAKPRRPRRVAGCGSPPIATSRSIPHGAAQGTGVFSRRAAESAEGGDNLRLTSVPLLQARRAERRLPTASVVGCHPVLTPAPGGATETPSSLSCPLCASWFNPQLLFSTTKDTNNTKPSLPPAIRRPAPFANGFLTPAALKTQRRQDNRNLPSPSAPPRLCAKTSPSNHPTKN